jgi:hypothetical protein
MSGSHEFMLTGTMPMAVFAASPEVIETLERLCVGGYDR